MAKQKSPQFVTKYIEATSDQVGDTALDQIVYARKIYRKRTEGFRRVRLSLADGTVREFRERFRVPVTVEV